MFGVSPYSITSQNSSSSLHGVYSDMLMEKIIGDMDPREQSKGFYEYLLSVEPKMKDIMTEEEFSDFFEKFFKSLVDGKIISIPEEFKDIGVEEDFTLYELLELVSEEILSNHPFNLVNKLHGSFDNTNSWIVTSPEPLSTIEFEIRILMNDMAS